MPFPQKEYTALLQLQLYANRQQWEERCVFETSAQATSATNAWYST